jgi:hypothetical protein
MMAKLFVSAPGEVEPVDDDRGVDWDTFSVLACAVA